ncbi:hypothetical protein G9A89_007219 [Geosiphon pyriformis]|nr:hypothetical protein G9A89_007219 [Geosiphon pyriformis]
MVFDYLVVDNELVLEPSLSLGHIFDGAFSGVMCSIDFEEFFGVVFNLPDGKAAGLLGISNKLWKHCNKSILDMLLVLLNCCLSDESVSNPWKESVLTNTCLIALIKMACKILSKILSDRISSACSTFDDALKKNQELWLVLQNMWKMYNSVGCDHLKKSLVRTKMCNRFIQFFGNIHRSHTNRVITDFGLTDGYCVYDSLDQNEVFSPLFVYEYRINSHFISKSGHVESQAGFFFFFAASAFVDDTIWVDSSQNATQHILNVASEFFQINNISINNKKMVAILINSRISDPSLFISGSPITIAKKGESYQYLGIFLLTEDLSKPNLAKAHLDVQFFTNLVLKKAVLDKQFLYLMLAILYSIVSYKTQFSFVSIGVYNKWNALICKGLELKSGLPLNFPSDTIHHSFFYGLKSFLQIQSESKIASLVSFCWHLVYLLVSPVCTCVCVSNNFLTDMVHILLDCNLSLGGFLASFFWFHNEMPMSAVLVLHMWSNFVIIMVLSLIGTLLSSEKGWTPFKLSAVFLNNVTFSSTRSTALCGAGSLNILNSNDFVSIYNCLSQVDASVLSVYTDRSLKNLGTINYSISAAVFFENIGLRLDVGIMGLMFSTLMELQVIVLALECVPLFSSVCLFLDSQSALDAYKSELGLACPNFCNQYWIECQHIFNVIHSKNLRVSWHKMKGHSGVLGNKCADMIASTTSLLGWCFPSHVDEHFIVADGNMVSSNFRHFVCDIFHSVCYAYWKVGSGCKFLENSLLSEINWICSLLVWHLDLHMTTGFTSRLSANAYTYFMKALYYCLPVVIQKHFYSRLYPSVLCLYCSEVEVSDHVFSCKIDESTHHQLLDFHVNSWRTLSGSTHASLCVLQLLSSCFSGSSMSIVLFKSFVFDGWFWKTISIFCNSKLAGLEIVKFMCSLNLAFRNNVWLVCAKHYVYIEKHSLILFDNLAVILVSGLSSGFSVGVVKLFGMANAFGICFGFRKSCLFFSDFSGLVSVYIAA